MKIKRSKKVQASPETPIQTPAPTLDPAALVEEAKKEPRIIAARDYIKTINILRHQKSFSFREIADWLNSRGVPLDNNEVYRAYMADMNWQEKQAMEQEGKVPDPQD